MTRYVRRTKRGEPPTHILPLSLQQYIVVYYVEGKDDYIVAYGGYDEEEAISAWKTATNRPEAIKVEYIQESIVTRVWHRGYESLEAPDYSHYND